jgi:hypothetical protein
VYKQVHIGEMRNAKTIVVENPEGKSPPGRLRHRWEDNYKMDLAESYRKK